MSEEAPSPNGPNGRASNGRFTPGWRGGPGNPHAAKVGALRSAMLRAVKPADMREVVKALVTKAKAGDVPAVRELLERTLGKPQEADLLDRIERLERLLQERGER